MTAEAATTHFKILGKFLNIPFILTIHAYQINFRSFVGFYLFATK